MNERESEMCITCGFLSKPCLCDGGRDVRGYAPSLSPEGIWLLVEAPSRLVQFGHLWYEVTDDVPRECANEPWAQEGYKFARRWPGS